MRNPLIFLILLATTANADTEQAALAIRLETLGAHTVMGDRREMQIPHEGESGAQLWSALESALLTRQDSYCRFTS